MKRLILFFALFILLVVTRFEFAKEPSLPAPPVYSMPCAVEVGKSTDITFYEEGLGEPLGLWTSFDSQAAPIKDGSGAGFAKYRITAAPDTPVGIYGVRLMTSTGASALRLLMVDDLPTVMSQGKNSTLALAQAITLPAAVEGTGEPLLADYYRMTGKAGQHLSAEVVANRLGSPMDPMIRLLDESGRELVYCDDSPGAGSDCRLAYVFPADGDYFVEVRDVNYEGGAGYRYRLRLGDFPLVTCVSPTGGERGRECKFHLECAGLQKYDDLTLKLPENSSRIWLKAKFPHGQGSALAAVLSTDLKEVVETEPNDQPGAANIIDVPTAISGHFEKTSDSDYLEVQGKKGEQLSVRGLTRSICSPATLSLQLLSSNGAKIAESNPAGPDDASMLATIPADGPYRILARELAGRGGPGMFYRLEIRDVQPGFSLAVDTGVVTAVVGKPVKLKVTAKRMNYDGPITLSLTGDSQDFELVNPVIPPGKNDVAVEAKITRQTASTNALNIVIVGKASIDGREVVERASTLAALKKLFPRLPAPPPELDGLIGVGVQASSP